MTREALDGYYMAYEPILTLPYLIHIYWNEICYLLFFYDVNNKVYEHMQWIIMKSYSNY